MLLQGIGIKLTSLIDLIVKLTLTKNKINSLSFGKCKTHAIRLLQLNDD